MCLKSHVKAGRTESLISTGNSNELLFAKWYDFVCSFWDGKWRNKLHPKLVPFSVSVLAVVTNKVETATCKVGREILYTTTSWKCFLRLPVYQN